MTLTCVTAPAPAAPPSSGVPQPPAAAPEAAGGGCPFAAAVPGTAPDQHLRASLVCLVNAMRRAAGVPRLRVDRRLERAAGGYAVAMRDGGFFSHVSPLGAGPAERVVASGYARRDRRWRVGENLAWGSGALATPAAVITGWMTSPPHRANVLDRRFRHLGLGLAAGAPGAPGSGAATYAGLFAARHARASSTGA